MKRAIALALFSAIALPLAGMAATEGPTGLLFPPGVTPEEAALQGMAADWMPLRMAGPFLLARPGPGATRPAGLLLALPLPWASGCGPSSTATSPSKAPR